jgi:hypothetical protein
MYYLPLEAFAYLEVWPLGHDGPVLLSVAAQALLCNFLCAGCPSLHFGDADNGCPGFKKLDSVLEPIAGVELPKEVFTSRTRWMPLIVKWKASSNLFYRLKHILLLILVIFKLKCNNIIFNKIMVLNASYVWLHAFSLLWESPDLDPERRTPHFWGGSVSDRSYDIRWPLLLWDMCHTGGFY